MSFNNILNIFITDILLNLENRFNDYKVINLINIFSCDLNYFLKTPYKKLKIIIEFMSSEKNLPQNTINEHVCVG